MNISNEGFFGEVFRGIWNGTDVAIKVFLEQDLTPENMESFCNEISILRYVRALFIDSASAYACILTPSAVSSALFQPPPASER